MIMNTLLAVFTFLSFLQLPLCSEAFTVSQHTCASLIATFNKRTSLHITSTRLHQARRSNTSNNSTNNNVQQKRTQTKEKNRISVHDIVEEYKKTAIKESSSASSRSSNKYKRSRKRVEKPKQKYVYAAQRREMERMGGGVIVHNNNNNNKEGENEETDDLNEQSSTTQVNRSSRIQLGEDSPITIARKMGLNPDMQSSYPSYTLNNNHKNNNNDDDDDDMKQMMIPLTQPQIVGEIRVSNGDADDKKDKSGMYAFIIDKPSGWSILEGNRKKNKKNTAKNNSDDQEKNDEMSTTNNNTTTNKDNKKNNNNNNKNNNNDKVKKLKYYDQDTSKVSTWDLDMNEFDLSSVMTAEELEEFNLDGGVDTFAYNGGTIPISASVSSSSSVATSESTESTEEESMTALSAVIDDSTNTDESNPSSNDNNDNGHNKPAIFLPESRPAVVTWLKELKASQGTPIRGGNNWKAIAGATDIDDSGLLILCPKGNVDNIFVDVSEYVLVVGNGKHLAPKGKKKNNSSGSNGGKQHTLNEVQFETYAKVKKGRGNDVVTTVKLNIPDGASTCNDAVQLSQNEFMDGVRGDGKANPLELRANRRLVHCSSMTVSSLTHDDLVQCESNVPDDIRVLAERRNDHTYTNGSFLGRGELCKDEGTTAYREINGAADGWPGWIVDRYDKWLLVQHDDMYIKGPLPSLHDGNTVGVYYFSSDPDRSITGAVRGVKPTLLEGQPAPDVIEVKENGIKYHVNFDDLSTGIFLDQRNQRAWLSRYCSEETRVLNCFAHCGAFSVAAAIAGAETVSLDLDKKWLDRIHPQMEANGIFDNGRHDCIYGDCKFAPAIDIAKGLFMSMYDVLTNLLTFL